VSWTRSHTTAARVASLLGALPSQALDDVHT